MINSYIGYSGHVTVKVLRGKLVVKTIANHNSGTAWLFKLFASTLCGKDESLNMPKFLDLTHTGIGSNERQSSLAARVTLTGKVIENKTADSLGAYAANFSAFIPSNLLTSTLIDKVELYSRSTGLDNKLAEVTLANGGLDLSDKGTYNLVVEWTMTFSNYVKSAN